MSEAAKHSMGSTGYSSPYMEVCGVAAFCRSPQKALPGSGGGGRGEGWTGLVRIILKEKIAPKPSVTETKVIQFICWVVKVCVEKGLQQERPVKIDMANMPYMYTVRVCTWHLSAQASRSSGGDSSGRLLPISSNILLQLL